MSNKGVSLWSKGYSSKYFHRGFLLTFHFLTATVQMEIRECLKWRMCICCDTCGPLYYANLDTPLHIRHNLHNKEISHAKIKECKLAETSIIIQKKLQRSISSLKRGSPYHVLGTCPTWMQPTIRTSKYQNIVIIIKCTLSKQTLIIVQYGQFNSVSSCLLVMNLSDAVSKPRLSLHYNISFFMSFESWLIEKNVLLQSIPWMVKRLYTHQWMETRSS